jgi:hypothetical protein
MLNRVQLIGNIAHYLEEQYILIATTNKFLK